MRTVVEILRDNKEIIAANFAVTKVGVFGSAARGTATEKSDVDILVEFRRGRRDFFNYMQLKFFLEKALGRPVDLVMKSALKRRLRDRVLNEVRYV